MHRRVERDIFSKTIPTSATRLIPKKGLYSLRDAQVSVMGGKEVLEKLNDHTGKSHLDQERTNL